MAYIYIIIGTFNYCRTVAHQLVYFIKSEAVLIDSRVETPIAVAFFTAKMITLSLEGPRGVYAVVTGLVAPVRRIEHSATLLIQGSVIASHNVQFQTLIQQVWRESVVGVNVVVVRQEEYVYQR